MHAPRPVRITAAQRESSRHVTISFADPQLGAIRPGQFAMVWVPGVDEVPMALWEGGGQYRMTVEAKGDATKRLCASQAGDVIGIRGPYGNGFQATGKDILLVGGGTGTVPLVSLAQRSVAERRRVRMVLGGRSKEFLLLAREFEAARVELHRATDDGSEGFHGRAHERVAQLIDERRPDAILTCGPERMMRAVAEIAWKLSIPLEASLERWMKCAVGICDACLVDGLRLCRDGPVLSGDVLKGLEDFGRYERGPDGRRIPLR